MVIFRSKTVFASPEDFNPLSAVSRRGGDAAAIGARRKINRSFGIFFDFNQNQNSPLKRHIF